MKKLEFLLLVAIFSFSFVRAQSITGQFTGHPNTQLSLMGYNGTKEINLGLSTTDEQGDFEISYKDYHGVANLSIANTDMRLPLILTTVNLQLKGTYLNAIDSLIVVKTHENKLFKNYIIALGQRENAFSGWLYLRKCYNDENSILMERQNVLKKINSEITALRKEDEQQLERLDKSLYVSWYLPLCKLMAEMPASVDHFGERIPEHIKTFRKINFNDKKFKTSGIRNDLIESHYWMLENSGVSNDSIWQSMNASTESILKNVSSDPSLYNELSLYLLKMLEKRSLFIPAEYLSLKLLSNDACTIDDKLADRAENYRAMKKGNTTKNIEFEKGAFRSGILESSIKSLSDIKSKRTLVIFGASWCPKCQEELLLIKKYYSTWQQKGIEVVFVSIDEDQQTFSAFSKIFPWLSTSDLKGWNGKAVKDYYVFGTPSLFLLDEKRTIVERMYSVEQMNHMMKFIP